MSLLKYFKAVSTLEVLATQPNSDRAVGILLAFWEAERRWGDVTKAKYR